MAGNRGNSHRRRDAEENQKRRHQEAAADSEHAGHEADRSAQPEDEEYVDRNIGDREEELHARSLDVWRERDAPARDEVAATRGMRRAPAYLKSSPVGVKI